MREIPTRISTYLKLVQDREDAFENPDPDGIVILKDVDEILTAEEEIKNRYLSKGVPVDWAECGIFYEDPWMILVRDVVRFPGNNVGTYHHIIFRDGQDGVVILPVLDGKIVLLRHFRNGARTWSWEIPRGGPTKADPLQNACTELVEEIGADISDIRKLGALRNNNGMISEVMHIYYAELRSIGKSNRAEGITDLKKVSSAELSELIRSGEIDDSHTVHAYTLARLEGLI